MDVTDGASVQAALHKHKPVVVVNCSAYTAVDLAESEHEKAFLLNRQGARVLAEACLAHDAALLHFSTDFVFDGLSAKPYSETDACRPLGVYGQSKREGEEAILSTACKGAIVRTSWLYSAHGKNFLKTMLRLGAEREVLGVVYDQTGTPTYAKDLVVFCMRLIEQDALHAPAALYHFSNEGVCSWYDFACAIMEIAGLPCKVNPILSEAYPTPARRPAYSVLDKSKIKKAAQTEIRHWRAALRESLSDMSL
jgi:dTDP-4-dehydrorhamnose reductase